MDSAPSKEVLLSISNSASDVNGIFEISDVKVRRYGSMYLVDMKISVSPHITVEEGHGLAARAKENILKNHNNVKDVLIHVNPYHSKE